MFCILHCSEHGDSRNEDRKKRKKNNDVASTRCRLMPLQVRIDKLVTSHKQFALRLLKYFADIDMLLIIDKQDTNN